jgi:hypothetical protein
VKLAHPSLLIGAVLLLASSLFAQAPHLTPFSADMQTSSSQANPVNHDMSGKIYVSPEAMRMDTQGGRGAANIITTFATQTVDIIMPQQQMYMEHRAGDNPMHRGPNTSDVHPYDPKNPCAGDPGSTCKNLGTETVNGRSTDHWQVTHKDGNISDVWIDNSLHFPIKTVSGGTTWQLTNIKEGPQDPSLFQVPSGYHKMDITGMGAMGGMPGGRAPQQ